MHIDSAHVTELTEPSPPLGAGDSAAHVLPFHPYAMPDDPTAVQFLAEMHDTPVAGPTPLVAGIKVHDFPFQESVNRNCALATW
jgi:hypothetical protein